MLTPFLLTLAIAASAPPVVQEDHVEAWSEDLLHLVEALDRMHPDLYFGVTRAEFEEAIDTLYGRLDQLTDDQVVAGLMRLVALISKEGRDGHSGVIPIFERQLPIRTYGFSDGWFIVAARPRHTALVGARLTAIEGTSIEEACAQLAPLLTRDNDQNLRNKLAVALIAPSMLHAIGLTEHDDRATLELVLADGTQSEVLVEGIESAGRTWYGRSFGALPPVGEELWLSNSTPAWWMRVLEEENALYVQYNEVRAVNSAGQNIADLGQEIVRTFEEHELDRVILDLRLNGGGDNTTFGPLIAALQESDAINRDGVLYGLIGRSTFSAAGNFVTVFERDTNAILVGEPTGGAPNQYGDARVVTLPNHVDVRILVSTVYHSFGGPEDLRLTHAAHLPVELTSTDYFDGRDSVLERALAHTP